MHLRKIILFAVVLTVSASVLVGFSVFLGSDTPEESPNMTETNGDDAGTDDTQPADAALLIQNLSLGEDAFELGGAVGGEVELASESGERASDTIEFQLTNDNGDVLDEGAAEAQTSDELSLTFAGIDVPSNIEKDELTLSAYAPSSGDTIEETFPVELPADENSVVLYPYQQNMNDENALTGDEIIITDSAGEEVERLTDWDRDDVRNNELVVDGLVEGETHTVEIPEPYGGAWPAESVEFDPGETDSVEIIAGYEFNSADSIRTVQGEYLDESYEFEGEEYRNSWSERFSVRAYGNDSDDIWASKSRAVTQQVDEDGTVLTHDGGPENVGSVAVGSDYNTDVLTVNALDEDGSANLSHARRGYAASTQNAFEQNNEELFRFEFIEEVDLEGSAVKDIIGEGIAVDDEDAVHDWLPSLSEADEELADMDTLHKFKYFLDPDSDLEYQYRWINPDTGELVRIQSPYPSHGEEYQGGVYYEFFGHDETTPDDFSVPLLNPDDFEMGEEYDKEELFDS